MLDVRGDLTLELFQGILLLFAYRSDLNQIQKQDQAGPDLGRACLSFFSASSHSRLFSLWALVSSASCFSMLLRSCCTLQPREE